MADLNEIAKTLVNLTIKEAVELAKIMKDDYGIEPAEPQAIMGFEPKTEVVIEEQTQFDVLMRSCGQTKLAVVKLVKELTSLGLKESKDLVDSAPAVIKAGVSKAEAEMLRTQLESAGAEMEIK